MFKDAVHQLCRCSSMPIKADADVHGIILLQKQILVLIVQKQLQMFITIEYCNVHHCAY